MVTVLDEEGPAVDGFVHRVAVGAPVGEVRHVAWDIATASGTDE